MRVSISDVQEVAWQWSLHTAWLWRRACHDDKGQKSNWYTRQQFRRLLPGRADRFALGHPGRSVLTAPLELGHGLTELPQSSVEKFARPPVGERCRRGVVVSAIKPGEGVPLTWIAVDGHVWFVGECRLDLGLCRLGNELVFFAKMHQQRRMETIDLAQILLSVTTVVGDRSVNVVAHCR